MKKISLGILAHVDAGKTTLSEALLYTSGAIRQAGRVDHGNAFLDTDVQERERGITIFSKQAVFSFGDTEFTLLDTPGHVDFAAEAERSIPAMDYAVLVISGTDGPQGHTKTLWRLLEKYHVPVFIFVNKMDLSGAKKDWLLTALSKNLSGNIVPFDAPRNEAFFESAALCSEALMEEYMATETICESSLLKAIRNRFVFPCFFGSALKFSGVLEFLESLSSLTLAPTYAEDFGALVYKISEDERGTRLTHLKITGGALSVRDSLSGQDWTEKVSEIRIYSGNKYKSIPTAPAGTVCAVSGLSKTYIGEGLGNTPNLSSPLLSPVFSYRVIPENADPHTTLLKLKKLEEEENQLHVLWNDRLSEIQIQVMGDVQIEILTRVLKERFSLSVRLENGGICYKETIESPVEGVGHFEPLRHYAEVHLLLEPLPVGSGLVFESDCPEEILAKNWQRLILTHLQEKQHIGVLTGAPITDMKITVKAGRAHQRHTEGGDFREATYRAVRHGLRGAKSILLEPFASFTLTLPQENIGRAVLDIETMGGMINAPEFTEDGAYLTGRAPFRTIRDYQKEVTVYTHGKGKLSFENAGYAPVKSPESIIAEIGYDPDSDIINSADSVFCSHGAGFVVPWQEVEDYMHIESILKPKTVASAPSAPRVPQKSFADDAVLMQIFERTYGKIKTPEIAAMHTPKEKKEVATYHSSKPKYDPDAPEYILIDGYNLLFATQGIDNDPELIEHARQMLIRRLCCYRILHSQEIILVFDAYKVKGHTRNIEKINDIYVVYTKEAETADSYIEKTSHELSRKHRVSVVTSDGLVQMIIWGTGAKRIPAQEFDAALSDAEKEIFRRIRDLNASEDLSDPKLRDFFENL